MKPASEFDLEAGGKLVRDTWIAWAKEQPNVKSSWVVPWEDLSEPEKEADRRIYAACRAAQVSVMAEGAHLEAAQVSKPKRGWGSWEAAVEAAQTSDDFWEAVNKETGDDVLSMAMDFENKRIRATELMDRIVARCEAVYRRAINAAVEKATTEAKHDEAWAKRGQKDYVIISSPERG